MSHPKSGGVIARTLIWIVTSSHIGGIRKESSKRGRPGESCATLGIAPKWTVQMKLRRLEATDADLILALEAAPEEMQHSTGTDLSDAGTTIGRIYFI